MADPEHFSDCPLCGVALTSPTRIRFDGIALLRCMNCGDHYVTGEACRLVNRWQLNDTERAALAHQVWKVKTEGVLVTAQLVEDLNRLAVLPGALERIDNLVLLLAEGTDPGDDISLHFYAWAARIGCRNGGGVRWVVEQAASMDLVSATDSRCKLTARGWQHYADLMTKGARSRHAFMAMRFSDRMWRVFQDHMRPAVAATGFELRPVSGDHQTAGSIDDRMRVEIRTSRFVVCDLSDANQGAYWEAGFAEGIGRPVLYTCSGDVLDGRREGVAVHFDTAHQLIIRWDEADMATGMRKLKNAIRATLKAEAKQEDDQGGQVAAGPDV